MQVSRREVLAVGALGGLGAAGLSLPVGASVQAKAASALATKYMPVPYATAFQRPPVLSPDRVERDASGRPLVAHYTVTAKPSTVEIVRGGLRTPVHGYNGSVPGPTISVDQGTQVRLTVRNMLPDTHPQFGHPFNISTHLHGSASLPQFDGYADDVTPPRHYKVYDYPNWQPARTLWYHDHGVHHTAQNAYSGLAAQYHLHDPVERELLPQGKYDVPLTVTDAMFAADGSLAYDDNTHSGLWGDVILVNGRPWPVMKVQPKIYRFRLLNASIARSYTFRLSDGSPLHVVATDGGLMPVAKSVKSYRHAGAERYEFLIDFSKYRAGTQVHLLNGSAKNNVDYDHTGKVMRFVVDPAADGPDQPWDPATGTGDRTLAALPTTLVGSEAMSLTRGQAVKTRRLRVARELDEWVINGKTWHDVQDSSYRMLVDNANPMPDDVEVWEIENKSGGWFHPVHIHLVDFQILDRNGRAPFEYEKGPKDTAYVGEGETVRVLVKFTLQPGGGNSANAGGRYMVHCHNLPHEDHDMMQQFAVGDPDVNDPVASAPPRPI